MRRGNGEGSIYRRDRGWEAAYYVDGRRRTFRARTSREARERLKEILQKLELGEPLPDEQLTVAEFLEYWLTVIESTIRPTTHKRYREYVRVHAVPEIGNLRLTKLKPIHLQRLYATRLQAGSSPSTVHHLHRTLHRALAMAERWEMVNRNVARLVTPPRVPKYKIRPLTAGEVRRLFAAAAGTRFEAACIVAVMTGVRLGELLALHWNDVELDRDPAVHVRGSLQRANGTLQILEPKTAGSVRDVALARIGAEALRAHRAGQNAERLRLGTPWEDHDLVFPNHWGRFMAPDYFTRREYRRLLEEAGLPRARFHDLRHTFATLQLDSRQPIKIVSEMMGHTRTAITQDLYTHVSAQMQRGAADALDVVLRPDDQISGQFEAT
jgi:integrase